MRGPDRGRAATSPGDAVKEVPCDERQFFESYLRATVHGRPTDRTTIGAISEPECRFHYNAVENSIIRVMMRLEPPPSGAMLEAWQALQKRRGRALLDVGSGVGHWIDFFQEVFAVTSVVGVEFTDGMAEFLREKYRERDDVHILQGDIADTSIIQDDFISRFDFVSAIGVLFHIIQDERWEQAIHNVSQVLKPGGLFFAGGDFGTETKNVQFHKVDVFSTWMEQRQAKPVDQELRVNKRIRSLSQWLSTASNCGLECVDLVRTDCDVAISTPENDLLVLRKVAASGID